MLLRLCSVNELNSDVVPVCVAGRAQASRLVAAVFFNQIVYDWSWLVVTILAFLAGSWGKPPCQCSGCCAALVMFACLAFTVQGSASEAELDRFFTEAPAAWEAIIDGYDGKTFDLSEDRVDRVIAPVEIEVARAIRRCEVHCFQECTRIDVQIESSGIDTDKVPSPDASLSSIKEMERKTENHKASSIRNDKYMASISLDSTPSLDALYHQDQSGFADKMLWTERRSYPGLSFDAYDWTLLSIEGMPDVIPSSDPVTWRVTDATVIDFQGASMVELNLDYSLIVDRSVLDRLESKTTVVLDPARSWSVVHSERKGKNQQAGTEFSCTVDITYSSIDKTDFHPETVLIVDELTDENSVNLIRSEFNISRLRDSALAPSDCYLTAFGLPEPNHAASRPWMIPAVITIFFALLAIWYRFRSRNLARGIRSPEIRNEQ